MHASVPVEFSGGENLKSCSESFCGNKTRAQPPKRVGFGEAKCGMRDRLAARGYGSEQLTGGASQLKGMETTGTKCAQNC
jgi:hypothetical protein